MWCTTAGVAGSAMEVPRVFGSSGVRVFTGAPEPATLLGDSGLTRTVVPATHVVHATVGAGRSAGGSTVGGLAALHGCWPALRADLITGRASLVAGREFLRARSHGIRDVVVLEGAS